MTLQFLPFGASLNLFFEAYAKATEVTLETIHPEMGGLAKRDLRFRFGQLVNRVFSAGKGFSEAAMKGEVAALFFAGMDTTAHSNTWVL